FLGRTGARRTVAGRHDPIVARPRQNWPSSATGAPRFGSPEPCLTVAMASVRSTHGTDQESAMKKQVWWLLAASLAAGPGWSAETEQTQRRLEGIGLGSGAAAGAIAGGPVGLIVGAALGGWLGDRFGAERDGRRAAEQGLEQARADNQ